VGQFISTDPALALDPKQATTNESPALYSYAKDDPVTFTDPDGRDVIIARGYDAVGHKESYIGQVADKLAKALSADKGDLDKSRVHYIGYEEIGDTVANIKAAGRSVSAFVYVGHAEEKKNLGELIPNVSRKTGVEPKEWNEKYPTLADVANLAQVADNGTIAIIGCRLFASAQALKDAETLGKNKKIRVIGSSIYNHTNGEGKVAISADEDNPQTPYQYAADLGIEDSIHDYTKQTPGAHKAPGAGPLDPEKYTTLKEGLIDADRRVPDPPKKP
jgi:hypothetical protein